MIYLIGVLISLGIATSDETNYCDGLTPVFDSIASQVEYLKTEKVWRGEELCLVDISTGEDIDCVVVPDAEIRILEDCEG